MIVTWITEVNKRNREMDGLKNYIENKINKTQ